MIHEITLTVGGEVLTDWLEYDISSSMVDPADSFSMTCPFTRKAFDLCAPDNKVTVSIDGTTILCGLIDDRTKDSAAGEIEISGRDLAGRLVQESAPQIEFNGMKMSAVIAELARPWFNRVSMTNARNRRLRRGKGRQARSANEPIFIESQSYRRIDPGQTRWAVIEDIVTKAGYLVWSSADGEELILGLPNFTQEPNWVFHHAMEGSKNRGTVKNMVILDSVGDRYSRIIVVGSGAGTDANYGSGVSSRVAEVRDNPDDPEGVGNAFKFPKRLVIPDDSIKSISDAASSARREMNRRNTDGHGLRITAENHGQLVGGVFPTLFAPDTVAICTDEETDLYGHYLITTCHYKSSRSNGDTTDMQLVKVGSELSS